MALELKLSISCHCGAAKQTVDPREKLSGSPQDINLCHCDACRHNTGLLCVSHIGIERPGSIEGLAEYRSTTKTVSRFFCATCGCHVFWRLRDSPQEWWAVATGVVIGLDGELEEGPTGIDVTGMPIRYVRHINTAGTRDGGLSPFLPRTRGGQELEVADADLGRSPLGERKEKGGGEVLSAFCHCRAVRFHITRPNAESRLPRSNFPDLMIPYHTGSPRIQNPDDEKWWLRPGRLGTSSAGAKTLLAEKDGPRRYLAGTCACRSCRLTSGFEIQTWAFVPRANIFFHIHSHDRNPGAPEPSESGTLNEVHREEKEKEKEKEEEEEEEEGIVPLDFGALPPGLLTSYESSRGVRREFCARCGATVFWRDRWRPELIDVSVGLLDAEEGARAETWLDWWAERVSFAEDAGNGRVGETARRAEGLVGGLEDGLRRWGGGEVSRCGREGLA
ncbi:putative glutathione-dependent formaldehyde-activating enzyme [Rosellinia necatrix]|uniref:Putative glutathione-dependent formaldehyde-activating enzyme n=1 Tax=Rosellinia necatrix TaxID=77044 RepID=A0A1W2TNK0_ROSNE|nr:putative glutathione-dependent formaldehyde-activating enzyme [Rosellinia necatrix]